MHRLPLSPLKYTVGVHRPVMIKWRGMGCMTTVTSLLNVTPPKLTFSVHGRVVMRRELYDYDHFTWGWICWPSVGIFFWVFFFFLRGCQCSLCLCICVCGYEYSGRSKAFQCFIKNISRHKQEAGFVRKWKKNMWVWKMKNRVRQEACVCLFVFAFDVLFAS